MIFGGCIVRINTRKIGLLFFIISINFYLILYIGKVYNLFIVNDLIRTIIIGALCVVVLISTFKFILVTKEINIAYAVFLLYFIYILVWTLLREQFNTTVLITSLFFCLVFLASYAIFTNIKSEEDFKIVKKAQFFMLVVFFMLYFYIRLVGNLNNGMVINSIYYQVLLLPFILIIDKPIIKRIGVALIIASVLFSMKRTAFIAVTLVLLIYFFSKKKSNLNLNKIVKRIFSSILLLLSLLFFIKSTSFFSENNIFDRFSTLVEDRGAGRLDIWIILFNEIKESSFIDLFLGHGIYTSSLVTGGFTAHNDFIEMLWSYGIGGLILYIGIYTVLIWYAIILKQRKYEYSSLFSASVLFFLIISLFSHLVFVPTYVAYLSLFWSFCICNYKNKKQYSKKSIEKYS